MEKSCKRASLAVDDCNQVGAVSLTAPDDDLSDGFVAVDNLRVNATAMRTKGSRYRLQILHPGRPFPPRRHQVHVQSRVSDFVTGLQTNYF